MIIRQQNNDATWYHITTYSDLPEELRKLEPLAYNLRFEWQPRLKDLFERIDADLWQEVRHNPVLFLRRLSQERIEAVMGDQVLLGSIDEAYKSLINYLA